MTWLTSEPLQKVKLLASLLWFIFIETQKIKVLRANQKDAKKKGGLGSFKGAFKGSIRVPLRGFRV